MRCPFLREAQVKFCRASAYKKMIIRLPEQPANERCSSKEYIHCPAAKQYTEDIPSVDHCPFLHESLVQYCTAAAVTKYIPYSESVNSQCGTESHRYCDLYLAIAHPGNTIDIHSASMSGAPINEHDSFDVDGIAVPHTLWFTPNHMWMEMTNDGIIHIGVDAFLTRILGSIDRLTFMTSTGVHRPTVLLTVNGIDMQLVFPFKIMITKANTYLRANPQKIIADPYRLGWLFEGTEEKQHTVASNGTVLVRGMNAVHWMKAELDRINALTHTLSSRADMQGAVLMADGGTFQPGIAHLLSREDFLLVVNEFFMLFPEKDSIS